VAVVLLLAGSVWASSEGVQKARRIAGYACGDAPAWDAMNDEDRSYVGPTRNAPGEWFNQKNEMPQDIDSEKILNQAVYAMAYSLEPSRSFTVSSGVNEKLIRKWLGKINTSIYGQVGVTADDDKVTLTVSHTPESRIMAAFRNSAMEDRLVGKEKDVLQTCSEWISGNISKGMPNGLKLKKIHDALVDNSRYTKGCYSTAEIVLEGKGVCAAYTSAAQLLMHMLKIDCRRIYGTQKMNHVWNYVEIDKEWYHMDVTWDDPTGNTDLRMYNYFLLTDVEMDADHDWVDADLYEPTPKINPWHFPVRNDIRRRLLLTPGSLGDDLCAFAAVIGGLPIFRNHPLAGGLVLNDGRLLRRWSPLGFFDRLRKRRRGHKPQHHADGNEEAQSPLPLC
jgi:hypothetical protein